jgi:DNA mismatch endonuclease (patch repair protein)
MADIFPSEKRSLIMASIKGKNTRPELSVRKALFKAGLRYRINNKALIGSPDIVLAKYRTLIFVHGCFWHGHNCKKGNLPNSNTLFWSTKISKNKVRDRQIVEKLEHLGWNVIEIWECQVSSNEKKAKTMGEVIVTIKSRKIN